MSLLRTRRCARHRDRRLGATLALAQAPAFFRIGTGGTAGTYYPVGGLIANTISAHRRRACRGWWRPPSPPTGRSPTSAPSSGGSRSPASRSPTWPIGPIPAPACSRARARSRTCALIADLYPETIHLVATQEFRHQVGRRPEGQARLARRAGLRHAGRCAHRAVAYGLTEKDIKAEYLKPGPAGDRLRDGALDAYFFVGGYPTGAISELATSSGITLVPIAGPQAEKMLAEYQFFSKDTVPAGTYKDVPETQTISVNAQWVTSAKQPDDLVYNIVKALWSDNVPHAARRRPCQGQADHPAERDQRHRHPAASGRREVLPGSGVLQ